jgi:dTDP-4-dehydrorhamnose 3,5-epimerase
MITKIQGRAHTDDRGRLVFFNEFSMDAVKRFYEINPSNTTIIRAWQGHLIEKKWFYCSQGAFVIYLIVLDKQGKLKANTRVERFVLESDHPIILEVPAGFASGFKATQENSKLIVFSDATVEVSIADDFRFEVNAVEVDWEK